MKKQSNFGILVDGFRPSKHPLYGTWQDMHRRCYDTKNKLFSYYGARGIEVCERWFSFANFVSDMGEKPSKLHTVDRVDNDGPYAPENCRWATKVEQARNRNPRSDSPFGVNGITRKGKKYIVTSTYNNVRYALGAYSNFDEAVSARTRFDETAAVDFDRAMSLAKGREFPNTGVRGVYVHIDGRFLARVYLNKKAHNLGIFNTIEEASNARQDFLAKQVA